MKKLITFIASLFLFFPLISCNFTSTIPNEEVVHVTSIELDKHSLDLNINDEETLIPTIYPENATNKKYSWTVSASNIVDFNNGNIVALNKGSAIITVTSEDGGFTDSCQINVNDLEEDIARRYKINEYGDYLEYISKDEDVSKLADEYKRLTTKNKYSTNGILEAEYQIGLYEFFNIENKVDITVNISQEELNKVNNDYYSGNRESYRMCSVDIKFIGLHFHYEEVGIRQKGNTSRGEILSGDKINLRHYRLSFEETFDDEFTSTPKVWDDPVAKEYREDRKFFGTGKLILRWNRNEDHTYLKEYYAYEMHRNSGSLAPRSNLSHLVFNIDGDEQNHGVYLAIENVDKSFIKRNFVKSARDGDLYKIGFDGNGNCGSFSSVDDSLFGVETLYKNGDNKFYQQVFVYDLKTNKDTSEHLAIKNFISTISNNDFHGGDAYDFMNTNSLYDEFIAYASSLYLLGDPDDLRGNCNNTYLYFAKNGESNIAVFIPTDHDRVLGSCGRGGNPTNSFAINESPFSSHFGYGPEGKSTLFNKTIVSSNSAQIRNDYLKKINSIIENGWLNSENFKRYYELARNHYSSDLQVGSKVNHDKIVLTVYEGNDITRNENLSINKYLKEKLSFFQNFIKENNISLDI